MFKIKLIYINIFIVLSIILLISGILIEVKITSFINNKIYNKLKNQYCKSNSFDSRKNNLYSFKPYGIINSKNILDGSKGKFIEYPNYDFIYKETLNNIDLNTFSYKGNYENEYEYIGSNSLDKEINTFNPNYIKLLNIFENERNLALASSNCNFKCLELLNIIYRESKTKSITHLLQYLPQFMKTCRTDFKKNNLDINIFNLQTSALIYVNKCLNIGIQQLSYLNCLDNSIKKINNCSNIDKSIKKYNISGLITKKTVSNMVYGYPSYLTGYIKMKLDFIPKLNLYCLSNKSLRDCNRINNEISNIIHYTNLICNSTKDYNTQYFCNTYKCSRNSSLGCISYTPGYIVNKYDNDKTLFNISSGCSNLYDPEIGRILEINNKSTISVYFNNKTIFPTSKELNNILNNKNLYKQIGINAFDGKDVPPKLLSSYINNKPYLDNLPIYINDLKNIVNLTTGDKLKKSLNTYGIINTDKLLYTKIYRLKADRYMITPQFYNQLTSNYTNFKYKGLIDISHKYGFPIFISLNDYIYNKFNNFNNLNIYNSNYHKINNVPDFSDISKHSFIDIHPIIGKTINAQLSFIVHYSLPPYESNNIQSNANLFSPNINSLELYPIYKFYMKAKINKQDASTFHYYLMIYNSLYIYYVPISISIASLIFLLIGYYLYRS